MLSRRGNAAMSDIDKELQALRQRLPPSSPATTATQPALGTAAVGMAVGNGVTVGHEVAPPPGPSLVMQGHYKVPTATSSSSAAVGRTQEEDAALLQYIQQAKKEFDDATSAINEFRYDEDMEAKATNKPQPVYNDPFVSMPLSTESAFAAFSANQLQDEGQGNAKVKGGSRLSTPPPQTMKPNATKLSPTPPKAAAPYSTLAAPGTASSSVSGTRGARMSNTFRPNVQSSKGKFKYASGVNVDSLYSVDGLGLESEQAKSLKSGGQSLRTTATPPIGGSRPLGQKQAVATATCTTTTSSDVLVINPTSPQKTTLMIEGGGSPQVGPGRASSSSADGVDWQLRYRPPVKMTMLEDGAIRFCSECHKVVLGSEEAECPHCGATVKAADVSELPVSHPQSFGGGTNTTTSGDVPTSSEAAEMLRDIEERERLVFQEAVAEWRALANQDSKKKGAVSGGTNTTSTANIDEKAKSAMVPILERPYFLHLWAQLRLQVEE